MTITKNPLDFSDKIRDEILIHLDGWTIATNSDVEDDDSEIEAFIDIEDPGQLAELRSNHKVGIGEVKYYWESSCQEALTETNRYNIDDLDEVLSEFFVNGVVKLAASNLWTKINKEVDINNEEKPVFDANASKLYTKSMRIIRKFSKSTLVGLSG